MVLTLNCKVRVNFVDVHVEFNLRILFDNSLYFALFPFDDETAPN